MVGKLEATPRRVREPIQGLEFLSKHIYHFDGDSGDLSRIEREFALFEELDPGISKKIIAFRLRHGLTGEAPLTYKEIARRLSISSQRAEQISKTILGKLMYRLQLRQPLSF